MTTSPEYKIVMMGDGGVGKTSIVEKLHTGNFSQRVSPTIGAAYVRSVIELSDRSITLSIWDTAGQEKFQSLVPLYIRNAHGVIFVFDVSAQNSLQELDSIYSAVQDQISRDMQVILCANKVDLVMGSLDLSEFKQWGSQHRMSLVRTSARTGEGVAELFVQLATQIAAKAERVRKVRFVPLDQEGGGAADGERRPCCGD
jgi:small GTP-binding protein